MKEMYEDLLGPDAADILQDALQRRSEVMRPEEISAIRSLSAGQNLTEMDKLSLNGLVMALADDFTSRRRAQVLQEELRAATQRPIEEEDAWIPDDEVVETLGGPDGRVGPGMAGFLEDLREDGDTVPEEDFEDFEGF